MHHLTLTISFTAHAHIIKYHVEWALFGVSKPSVGTRLIAMFLACRVVSCGKVIVSDVIKEVHEGQSCESFAAFFLSNFG